MTGCLVGSAQQRLLWLGKDRRGTPRGCPHRHALSVNDDNDCHDSALWSNASNAGQCQALCGNAGNAAMRDNAGNTHIAKQRSSGHLWWVPALSSIPRQRGNDGADRRCGAMKPMIAWPCMVGNAGNTGRCAQRPHCKAMIVGAPTRGAPMIWD